MTLRRLGICISMVLPAFAAQAAPPSVVADTPPIHSITAMVMEGVAEPGLLLASGASAHDYSLRPSEARLVQGADLVIWVGSDLTPWLARPLETLAPEAARLSLLDAEGTMLLPVRSEARFGTDDHDHDHDHEHHEGAVDPHAWLDPENAIVWAHAIAGALSEIDPGNAAAYRENAIAAETAIRGAEAGAVERLSDAGGAGFIVFHDAYQYFESHFGINAAGAIALHDATAPGAGRLAELQRMASESGVTCILSEVQFDRGLATALAEGRALSIGVADPLGTGLEPGAGLYPALIEGLAATISDCIGG